MLFRDCNQLKLRQKLCTAFEFRDITAWRRNRGVKFKTIAIEIIAAKPVLMQLTLHAYAAPPLVSDLTTTESAAGSVV